jgi:hypothetical protein
VQAAGPYVVYIRVRVFHLQRECTSWAWQGMCAPRTLWEESAVWTSSDHLKALARCHAPDYAACRLVELPWGNPRAGSVCPRHERTEPRATQSLFSTIPLLALSSAHTCTAVPPEPTVQTCAQLQSVGGVPLCACALSESLHSTRKLSHRT